MMCRWLRSICRARSAHVSVKVLRHFDVKEGAIRRSASLVATKINIEVHQGGLPQDKPKHNCHNPERGQKHNKSTLGVSQIESLHAAILISRRPDGIRVPQLIPEKRPGSYRGVGEARELCSGPFSQGEVLGHGVEVDAGRRSGDVHIAS